MTNKKDNCLLINSQCIHKGNTNKTSVHKDTSNQNNQDQDNYNCNSKSKKQCRKSPISFHFQKLFFSPHTILCQNLENYITPAYFELGTKQ